MTNCDPNSTGRRHLLQWSRRMDLIHTLNGQCTWWSAYSCRLHWHFPDCLTQWQDCWLDGVSEIWGGIIQVINVIKMLEQAVTHWCDCAALAARSDGVQHPSDRGGGHRRFQSCAGQYAVGRPRQRTVRSILVRGETFAKATPTDRRHERSRRCRVVLEKRERADVVSLRRNMARLSYLSRSGDIVTFTCNP
jgi:hypothetical protein